MASVSVYAGIGSILERINSIFGQFQQQIWTDVWVYGGKYHFWGGNTTFWSVVWAVGLISRSDLVQVVVYGKCEYT